MQTRRDFNQNMLGSIMAFGLIETLFTKNLLADGVKPTIGKWITDLHNLGQDLKNQKLKDVDFQAKMEELYKSIDLADLIKCMDLDRLDREAKYPAKGAASLLFDLRKVEGVPQKLTFGRQIFAMKKDRSVVPHGHDNMATGFLVLRGDFTGKHFDRIEDNKDHYLVKPTIDRTFKPGETSSISDHKDNVHWFKCQSDVGFIFNIHVNGYNPANKNSISRVYVDPDGEKVQGGLIVAKKISSKLCHEKYG